MTPDFAMPVDLECSYEYDNWDAVGIIYYCDVRNELNIISSESAVITGASENHDDSKNNADVYGFYAYEQKTEVFPRGLEKIFKNIKFINIQYGRIKEIHQSDLKPFPQLKYLSFWQNDIETIEEGLFDFNPKLAVIGLDGNKISKIHPNVFDHLSNLYSLWLRQNQCIDNYAQDNSTAVKEVIKHVKLQCPIIVPQ